MIGGPLVLEISHFFCPKVTKRLQKKREYATARHGALRCKEFPSCKRMRPLHKLLSTSMCAGLSSRRGWKQSTTSAVESGGCPQCSIVGARLGWQGVWAGRVAGRGFSGYINLHTHTSWV